LPLRLLHLLLWQLLPLLLTPHLLRLPLRLLWLLLLNRQRSKPVLANKKADASRLFYWLLGASKNPNF